MKQETLDKIKQIVSEEFEVPVEELTGRRTTDYISAARHVLHRNLYVIGYTTIMVGEMVGKSYSAVVHSNKIYYRLYQNDKFFKAKAKRAEARIESLITGEPINIDVNEE